MTKEVRSFQAEVKPVLDLMIHALYSHKEIYLRELISNASDALDKLRFEEITHPDWATADKHISLAIDPLEKKLTISDNGIGMTYEEVIENIGTIAHSGSKKFLKTLQAAKEKPELIGQFGVGFYSAFMVAKEVVLHSQKAGTNEGTVWRSNGDGTYEMERKPRPDGTGTTIELYLKDLSEAADSEGVESQDFADEWTLRQIIKKYSDFISYPIRMNVKRSEPELDAEGKEVEGKYTETEKVEVLNSQKALWLRPAKEIKKEEYDEFYKQICQDFRDPLEVVHFRAEGTHEFSALLYVPSEVPYDYHYRDAKFGLQLYVKRVFITHQCENLLPNYLRFVRGVVDSSDLPLNISREMIQKDRELFKIQKALEGKIIRHLKNLSEGQKEQYLKFWELFGPTLKEGVPSVHGSQRDDLMSLLLFHSTNGKELTSLKDYSSRMKPEQKSIYFITGENLLQVQASPHIEKLRKKGFEVLCLVDHVDEWLMNSINEFEGKKFASVTHESAEFETEDEKKQSEVELKANEEKLKPLTDVFKSVLSEEIKDVRISQRLEDSAVCLVSGENDYSAHMERLLEKMGKEMPKSKKILELNPKHPVFQRMLLIPQEKQQLWAEVLYGQALLSEGAQLKDPVKFSKQLSDLMLS